MPTVSEIICPAFSRLGRHLGITLYLVYISEMERNMDLSKLSYIC